MSRVIVENVVSVWKSINDENVTVDIEPSWYEENGTPIDEEGDDMVYVRTELIINGSEQSDECIKGVIDAYNNLDSYKRGGATINVSIG